MSLSWKGGATLAVGKPFQAQFELGDVEWATEYNNGAYVELRKQGEEELIDWYRLHEDRTGGFEWADSATPTEPGTYEFVLRSTGDPFEPALAPETVQFLESCSALEPGKYKLSGSETTDCAGNNTWPIKKFKVKLREDGTIKGKLKFNESHNSAKQKCKVSGTWDADAGNMSYEYDFEWASGNEDHFVCTATVEGDEFQGTYESPTAGSTGTLKLNLHKYEAFSSSDEDYDDD